MSTRDRPIRRWCRGAAVVLAAGVLLTGCTTGPTPAPGRTTSGSGDEEPAPGCAAPPVAPTVTRTPPRPAPTVAPGAIATAVLHTNCGDVTVVLDGPRAPRTVAWFAAAARAGVWDDDACHRLTMGIPDVRIAATTDHAFILQCGAWDGVGHGLAVENVPADGSYPRGTLALMRDDDPGHDDGPFFVVYRASRLPTAAGGYSVFGTVTGGLGIVEAIAALGGEDGRPDAPPFRSISILSISVTSS